MAYKKGQLRREDLTDKQYDSLCQVFQFIHDWRERKRLKAIASEIPKQQ